MFRKVAILAVAATLSTAVITGSDTTTRSAVATPRRNIVVIETDDMRADELQYLTKTLALLQGTQFTKSYVSTSLCCPSRAAFLSGQYTQNNGVPNNNAGANFNDANSLATWLQNDGYFTTVIGKYLNGYGCSSDTPPNWDHWQVLCANIYSMLGFSLKDNGSVVVYPKNQANYQTDVLATRAANTITEASNSGKPFFMWLTPTAPHGGPGVRVATRYAKALSTYTLPSKPSFNEADLSDKPAWLQGLPLVRAGVVKKSEIVRLRMLLAVDDMVERVVNQLTAVGELANTDIIFTSDNGFMRGEHRVASGKEIGYEESLAVPLLMSGPDFPVGTNSTVVTNTDLAPTIAAIAGVTPTLLVDGRNLLPIVQGTEAAPDRVVRHFVTPDSTNDGGSPPHPLANGVRSPRFTYFELATGEKELYDHTVDPYELTNFANRPEYATAQDRLETLNATLATCVGAACEMALGNLKPTAEQTSLCPNLVCAFDASGSGDLDGTIASYHWTFGDGASVTKSTPTANHTYNASGVYEVVLTVTDNGGATSTLTQYVTGTILNLPPTAAFTSACHELSCAFDGSGSFDLDGTLESYQWNFGDGTTSTLVSPSHDYLLPGDFTVTLTVTDDRGATASESATVTVTPPNVAPVAVATKSCGSMMCDFDATTSTDIDGNIVTYEWDFGDGFLGSGAAVSHTYEFNGVYSVTLVVTDDDGATNTLVFPVTIT